MAATLAMGPGTVLSHRTAAELWGISPRSRRAVEVTRSTHVRGRLHLVPHRSSLPDDERATVDGIPVTTVPRTILDLASVASRRRVEQALNETEVLGLTDRLSVPDLLDRYPRRRGSAVLRDLLRRDDAMRGMTRSPLEERFASFLDIHGLPRPRFNADLAVRGRFFVVDCLWEDERLVVELDGRAVHGTVHAFESDRERDRLLLIDGWRVMRVTWRQLHDQEPTIATDLRKALALGRSSRLAPVRGST
jgi:very-short-patch-repair endonuclease